MEDGAIQGRAVIRDYGYLQAENNFKHFGYLAMRFKCEGQGNSGVFFHFDSSSEKAELMTGFQFEVDCSSHPISRTPSRTPLTRPSRHHRLL